MNRAAWQERRDDRRQEDEIDESEPHRAEREGWAPEDEVDVGEGADEREQDAKADAERRTHPRVAQVCDPRREGRARGRPHLHHWGRLRDCVIDEYRTGEVEDGKEIEIPGQAQVIGDPRRYQATNQIARD